MGWQSKLTTQTQGSLKTVYALSRNKTVFRLPCWLDVGKKIRSFCNEREIYKGENRGEISNRNARLNGAYYVFLFHGCQINNGANCAKFCLIFVDIQHFMLFVVAVGVV